MDITCSEPELEIQRQSADVRGQRSRTVDITCSGTELEIQRHSQLM